MISLREVLRGQNKGSVKYILLPESFSYKTFYNTYEDINNSKGIYADYWHSGEDHHIGFHKQGEVTVESIGGPKQTLDNAEAAIKELTGAVSVRLHTDVP